MNRLTFYAQPRPRKRFPVSSQCFYLNPRIGLTALRMPCVLSAEMPKQPYQSSSATICAIPPSQVTTRGSQELPLHWAKLEVSLMTRSLASATLAATVLFLQPLCKNCQRNGECGTTLSSRDVSHRGNPKGLV